MQVPGIRASGVALLTLRRKGSAYEPIDLATRWGRLGSARDEGRPTPPWAPPRLSFRFPSWLFSRTCRIAEKVACRLLCDILPGSEAIRCSRGAIGSCRRRDSHDWNHKEA